VLFVIALVCVRDYNERMTTTRAIAYLRVSTDKQADHGVSLEAQEAKVRAYASLYDLDLVDVVIDAGASAKTLDRPGLARVLDAVKRGTVDAVVVVKLDRLTRNVADLGHLVERYFQKAALLSVSEQIDTRTAAGRLVLNVLASVAQWEREAIGERTSVAMKHKAAKGELVGAVPYGYALADDGVALVEVEAEQAVICEARALRAAGVSLRAVAAELAARGLVARNGRPFAAEQVRRMVAA
jgi:DNA invertase Pin-like site-specific DNA recombinase